MHAQRASELCTSPLGTPAAIFHTTMAERFASFPFCAWERDTAQSQVETHVAPEMSRWGYWWLFRSYYFKNIVLPPALRLLSPLVSTAHLLPVSLSCQEVTLPPWQKRMGEIPAPPANDVIRARMSPTNAQSNGMLRLRGKLGRGLAFAPLSGDAAVRGSHSPWITSNPSGLRPESPLAGISARGTGQTALAPGANSWCPCLWLAV